MNEKKRSGQEVYTQELEGKKWTRDLYRIEKSGNDVTCY